MNFFGADVNMMDRISMVSGRSRATVAPARPGPRAEEFKGCLLWLALLWLALHPASVQAATKHHAKSAEDAEESAPASIRGVPVIYREPYAGMIAVDGATGKVLAEDHADATVYPASVIKLMNLFVVLDQIQQGKIHLADSVEINAEESHMGGSRVYLKEHETFSVEDLIYALMVQSANDAALTLGTHVAGSQQAFVELMNQKAQALGMTHTHFYSCHGLPPTPPRKPTEVDVSTPRDLSILARALVAAHPEVLQYTSTMRRTFRPGPHEIDMINHNHRLLSSCAGADGLKTGYFDAAGYSSIVTAKRNDRRVFVVVAGSGRKQKDLGKGRDKVAAEIMNRAFMALPPAPPPPPPPAPVTNVVPVAAAAKPEALAPAASEEVPVKKASSNGRMIVIVLGVVGLGALAVAGFFAWSRMRNDNLVIEDDLNRPRRPFPPLK